MSTRQVRDVTVRLDDVQDLFIEPVPGSERSVSFLEELYRAIRAQTRVRTRPDSYQVTIELRHEKATAGLAEDLHARITRYCHFQAQASRQDLLNRRHQGMDSPWTGFFVLAPCLILGGTSSWQSQLGIHSALQAVLLGLVVMFVLIAGWLALWIPAEFFLYDPWPFQQELRVYQYIADAAIVIKEQRLEAPAEVVSTPRSNRSGALA